MFGGSLAINELRTWLLRLSGIYLFGTTEYLLSRLKALRVIV